MIENLSLVKLFAATAAKSLQSCLTLCDPIDGSPPGSPVPEILQARTPEWVAISFSNAWKWKVKVKSLSRVRLLATPWTAAHQASPSMGFSRQEYWSGVPLTAFQNNVIFCFFFIVMWNKNLSSRAKKRLDSNQDFATSYVFSRKVASYLISLDLSSLICKWE